MAALGYVAAALWGALWGSFMNVCITRVPAGESVVSPRSHCRTCGALVRWVDNLPIVSYLWLRGHCRQCRASFSAQYLVVEIVSTVLALLLWYSVVVRSAQPLSMELAARWLAHFAFVGVLIVVSAIDLATYRIPNVITYPGIPAFVAVSFLLGQPRWWEGLAGAVAGYAALRLLADGYFWMTGREGMGYGDAKLLALTAGFLGLRSLLPTVFVASTIGAIFGITVALLRRRNGDETSIRLTRVPFGPFLALGATVYLFVGDPLESIVSIWIAGR